MRVNTICLPAGHCRVEEGSEHYLFYELEERLKRPFIHGWIVGLGVHLLSRLQENRHAEAVARRDGAIVLLGAFLLLLQASVDRPRIVAHPVPARTPMAA